MECKNCNQSWCACEEICYYLDAVAAANDIIDNAIQIGSSKRCLACFFDPCRCKEGLENK